MNTPVLIRAELLEGLDEDGNARVVIPYCEGTDAPHGRVRFVDPGCVMRADDPDAVAGFIAGLRAPQ